MELKGRLGLIAAKTPKSNTVCDIGTDHAYIPIYLVQKGICKRAIAADINEGPIEAANDNVRKYELKGKIETRLGNGLEPIKIGEADTIIIAGMGGNLIAEILQRDIHKAKAAKALILQPMNDIDITRKWLYDNSFEIFDEELVQEGAKIYNVICTKWSGEVSAVSKSIYYLVGEKLIQNSDPLLGKLISKKIKQLESAIDELQNASEASKKIMESYSLTLKELRHLEENL